MGEPHGPTSRLCSSGDCIRYRCRAHHRKKPKSEKGRILPMANPRLPQKQAPELRNKSPQLRINKQITRVKKMTKQDLKSMSVDELWSLHERVTSALARKITDEKSQLDHRL